MNNRPTQIESSDQASEFAQINLDLIEKMLDEIIFMDELELDPETIEDIKMNVFTALLGCLGLDKKKSRAYKQIETALYEAIETSEVWERNNVLTEELSAVQADTQLALDADDLLAFPNDKGEAFDPLDPKSLRTSIPQQVAIARMAWQISAVFAPPHIRNNPTEAAACLAAIYEDTSKERSRLNREYYRILRQIGGVLINNNGTKGADVYEKAYGKNEGHLTVHNPRFGF